MGRLVGLLMLVAAGLAEGSESWARLYSSKSWFEINVDLDDFRLTRQGGGIVVSLIGDDFDQGEGNAAFCHWVARLDGSGEISWQRCYNGIWVNSVLPTRDDGMVLIGVVGDPDAPPGEGGFLAKLDAHGSVQWQTRYQLPQGVSGSLFDARETEAGYIAIGEIESDEWEDTKAWILGLDPAGNLRWQKTLTGFGATALQPTDDGHFLIAGWIETSAEAWLLKLDPNGKILWQRTYRGEEIGGFREPLIAGDVQEDASGELLLAGTTLQLSEQRPSSAWIARLDREGHVKWRKIYGEGISDALMRQVLPASDGGMYALGWGGEGSEDGKVWLAKLTAEGEIEWQRLYGQEGWGEVFLQRLEDGHLLLAGASFLDAPGDWLLKLEPDGSLAGCALASPVAISARQAQLSERTIAVAETPPEVSVLSGDWVKTSPKQVTSLPACPAEQAFASCSQIQKAGKSFGSGVYPIALQAPLGPELLGAFCEMEAFGGGWMLIARHDLRDPKPPEDFVRLRFGVYNNEEGESFSIWPQVNFDATEGLIGLSWDGQAKLLKELTFQELQAILATSSSVKAWVR